MPEHLDVDIGRPTLTRLDLTAPMPMADDGYPAGFGDQRTMLPNGLDCETAEDVFWRCWVPHLEQYQGVEPVMDDREVTPYLNAGRWIADCPACADRGLAAAMACWDRNPYACCLGLGCGHVFKVRWQLPQQRSEVMRLLAGRPEGNRNWDAHRGETLEELKVQNVLMLGVPAVERNALLMAENVRVPDELGSPDEYLDKMRRDRRAAR